MIPPGRRRAMVRDAIRDASPAFSPAECANHFTATGHEPE
jgi:hypothetical protein